MTHERAHARDARRAHPLGAALLAAALAVPFSAAAGAEDPHAACKAAAETAKAEKPAAAPAGGASVVLEDLPLVDHDGNSRRFRSEIVGDRIVVMDFIFTTCTTICPVLSSRMARLQEALGDRLGREVFLLSISVDPVRDTSAKLGAYAKKWKARSGWTFLTGPKPDVDAILKGVGAYTADFAGHPPMFLVGDGKAGRWVRLNGFPDVTEILKQVDELAATRPQKSVALGGGLP